MNNKPNILIFNPDQWRGDMLGYLSYPGSQTPNLDSIIKDDAVAFKNAFCQATVCTPSRCSFMTGWYPHVHGHRTMHYMLHTDQGDSSILSELKNKDYFIWWGGKNDLIAGQEGYRNHCDIILNQRIEIFKNGATLNNLALMAVIYHGEVLKMEIIIIVFLKEN